MQAKQYGGAATADCMCTLVATRCPEASSATRNIPHNVLQLCSAADDACSHAWNRHNDAVTRLRACITAYITHVPKLPGLMYVRSTHHCAWLQVLNGLRESTAGSADQHGIAAALLEAPVVTPGAIQAAVRPLLATAALLQRAKDCASHACDTHKPPKPHTATPVATRVVALSVGARGALREGLAESFASVVSVVSSCMRHMHDVRSEAMAERQWRAAPAQHAALSTNTAGGVVGTDAWAAWAQAPVAMQDMRAAHASTDILKDDRSGMSMLPQHASGTGEHGEGNATKGLGAKAATLFVDGQLQNVLEQITDFLKELSENKDAHHALSDAHMHSALITAAPHVKLLREGAGMFEKIGSAASRVVALQAFLTNAFCPCMLSIMSAPLAGVSVGMHAHDAQATTDVTTVSTVHIIQYYHKIFQDAAMHARYHVRTLVTAHRKAQQYKVLMESCETELADIQQALLDLDAEQATPVATIGHAELASRRGTLLQRQYTLKSALDRRATHSAELSIAVSKAASAVRVCMHDLKAALSTSAHLQEAVQQHVAAQFAPDSFVKGPQNAAGAPQAGSTAHSAAVSLDVDAVLASCGVKQSIEQSAEVFGPLVCGVFNEFSSVLVPMELNDTDSSTAVASQQNELHVPALWYTGAAAAPHPPHSGATATAGAAATASSAFSSSHLSSGNIWGNDSGIWGAPTSTAAGAPGFFGGFSSNAMNLTPGVGGIWEDPLQTLGAGDNAGGAAGSDEDSVTWPTSLNDIWTDVAALFAVESILEAAMEASSYPVAPSAVHADDASAAMHASHASGRGRGAKAGRSRGRGRNKRRNDHMHAVTSSHTTMHAVTLPATNIQASPQALKHLSDEACMCIADVMIASVGALTCSHLTSFMTSISQSSSHAGSPLPDMWGAEHASHDAYMHAPNAYSHGERHTTGSNMWAALGDHGPPAQGAMHGTHALEPQTGDAGQGGRQLQAFTHFDTNLAGADMMLGGLSDCGSLEQDSFNGDALEGALESFEDDSDLLGGSGSGAGDAAAAAGNITNVSNLQGTGGALESDALEDPDSVDRGGSGSGGGGAGGVVGGGSLEGEGTLPHEGGPDMHGQSTATLEQVRCALISVFCA